MTDYVYKSQGSIKVPRTRFDLSHHHKTMFNAGEIIPLDWQEVYPGDTIKCNLNTAIRTVSPFVRPVIDNMFIDIYSFFVPNRLLWEHWEDFITGGPEPDSWSNPSNFRVPFVTAGVVSVNSLADYLGIPPADYESESVPLEVNALPFRAYALIYNEYWRNQNVDESVYIDKSGSSHAINNNDWSPTNIFGKPAKANKLNDYFTSCLPAPQKGDPVYISAKLDLPVITGTDNINSLTANNIPLHFGLATNASSVSGTHVLGISGANLFAGSTSPGTSSGNLVVKNLHAVSGSPVASAETALFNVEELREAKALQVALEKDARGGTRLIEYLYSHWNVVADNQVLQRPELLAGVRMPLNIQQVAQTSASQNDTDKLLGQVGAMSLSNPSAQFEKGFSEHGIVMTLAVIRQHHTYQQGVDRAFFRQYRFDYYDPSFAHIGEQPVYKRELDVIHQGMTDNVFGYNEAFADLRFRPSRISGSLRSSADQGFDIWHFGDEYANTPGLSAEFLKETDAYINRALAVPSSTAPQFLVDCYFKESCIRCLPINSIPSYLD